MTQSPKSGPLTASPEDPEATESSARGARNVWGAPVSPWPTMSRGISVFANVSLCQVACLEPCHGRIWWIGWIFKTKTCFLPIQKLIHDMLGSKSEVTRISLICWKFQRVSWSWSLGSGLDSLQRSTKVFGRERKIPSGTLAVKPDESASFLRIWTIFAFSFSILLLNLLFINFWLSFQVGNHEALLFRKVLGMFFHHWRWWPSSRSPKMLRCARSSNWPLCARWASWPRRHLDVVFESLDNS